MATLTVQHHVKDYDAWKPVFDEDGINRRANGAKQHTVYRGGEDNNDITIVTEFESREGALAFMGNPALKEAMHRAGVDSEPHVTLGEQVEAITY